jgi:ribonuclease P protein subunit RPR2
MQSSRKSIIKSSVRSSIERLLDQARKAYTGRMPDRSRRYVEMAFQLLRKNKAKLPKELKNSFCRKCFQVWIPGKTATVSFDRKNNCLRIKCGCGHSKRL